MPENLFQASAFTSLTDGWIPLVVQVLTVVLLVLAVGWRSRRRPVVTVPFMVAAGILTAVAAHWAFGALGLASEPAPRQLWLWVGLSGLALGAVVAGWRGARWSRRNLTVLAASLCLLSTGLTINGWIGYFPTVTSAFSQLADRPLPGETDWSTVESMQRSGIPPSRGAVLRVNITANASGFDHRQEIVYLPPAWFATTPPPRLPTVMMIGGQFNTPADWLRAGDAISTLDAYAAAHGGNAPVAVFVDPSGSFTNDTECVNGSRGNAADHLTEDVVPQMVSDFGVSAVRDNWGVVGFSTGGTCAIGLAVMHPEMFGVFVDIAGDLSPNAGDRQQTIDRLFGGDAAAWASFDPSTVIARHGRYSDLAGLFVVPSATSGDAANTLWRLGTANGIESTVVQLPGRHMWPFAETAFATTLPWLAGELGSSESSQTPVPKSGN